jgi:hypothetical protein
VTLDDVIAALLELRAQYPAAGLATVVCPLDVSAVFYESGEVFIGLTHEAPDDEGDDEDDNDEDDDFDRLPPTH